MADIKKDQDALFNTIYKIATDLVHAGHVSECITGIPKLGESFFP